MTPALDPVRREELRKLVDVKPLLWCEQQVDRGDGFSDPTGDWQADTMIGEYTVTFDPDEDVKNTPWCAWTPLENLGHFGESDEARSALQASFDDAVLSFITPNDTTLAMLARIAELEAVPKVKPLEWKTVDGAGDGTDVWEEAPTPFGPYTVSHVERYSLPYLLEPFRSNLDSNYATMEAAISSAQADYESRILAALLPKASVREERG